MAEKIELQEIGDEPDVQEEGAFGRVVDTNLDKELDMSDIPAVELTGRTTSQLLDTYFNDMEKTYGVKLPEGERAVLKISLKIQNNNLYYKPHGVKSKLVPLTTKNGKRFLSPSTIQRPAGGSEFLEIIGLKRIDGKWVPRVSEAVTNQPLEPTVIIRSPIKLEEFEMDILNNPDQIQQVLHNETLNEILTAQDRRELQGLEEIIHSTHSKILSTRLSEEHFRFEKNKAKKELDRSKSVNNEEEIKFWEGEIVRFDTQEIVWKNARESLEIDERNQVDRVRGILQKKVSLTERIRELFRKEGVTIASLLSAVGLTISTIALSIRLALNPSGGSPSTPRGSNKFTDKIRDALKNFGKFLLDLAKKSASALPSLIGTIVSFLFKTAGQVVGFLAEHLIILMIGVVALVFEVIIKKSKRST